MVRSVVFIIHPVFDAYQHLQARGKKLRSTPTIDIVIGHPEDVNSLLDERGKEARNAVKLAKQWDRDSVKTQ